MLALLADAVDHGAELIAYPEMALTTYFPKRIRRDFDQFFETEVPPKVLEPLTVLGPDGAIELKPGFGCYLPRGGTQATIAGGVR